MPQQIFLTAEWNNLLMLNYVVDPSMLHPYLPAGIALDTFDGSTYVSLVGFEFNNTRISGFSVPFHGSFEEVNLGFTSSVARSAVSPSFVNWCRSLRLQPSRDLRTAKDTHACR